MQALRACDGRDRMDVIELHLRPGALQVYLDQLRAGTRSPFPLLADALERSGGDPTRVRTEQQAMFMEIAFRMCVAGTFDYKELQRRLSDTHCRALLDFGALSRHNRPVVSCFSFNLLSTMSFAPPQSRPKAWTRSTPPTPACRGRTASSSYASCCARCCMTGARPFYACKRAPSPTSRRTC